MSNSLKIKAWVSLLPEAQLIFTALYNNFGTKSELK